MKRKFDMINQDDRVVYEGNFGTVVAYFNEIDSMMDWVTIRMDSGQMWSVKVRDLMIDPVFKKYKHLKGLYEKEV